MKRIEIIVEFCIRQGYVTKEKAPWLHYALEKRVTSVLIFIPLCIIGLLITSAITFFSFCFTFYLLRSVCNGWHAKTISRCLICSIIAEIVFLVVLPNLCGSITSDICLAISIASIWWLAPYNHPDMNLSEAEISVCKKCVKKRLIFLAFSLVVARIFQLTDCCDGIQLGVFMTAITLILGYIMR